VSSFGLVYIFVSFHVLVLGVLFQFFRGLAFRFSLYFFGGVVSWWFSFWWLFCSVVVWWLAFIAIGWLRWWLSVTSWWMLVTRLFVWRKILFTVWWFGLNRLCFLRLARHFREGPPECDGKRDISAVGHF
jgi:hypothetical protein